jgi:hypothetical protein
MQCQESILDNNVDFMVTLFVANMPLDYCPESIKYSLFNNLLPLSVTLCEKRLFSTESVSSLVLTKHWFTILTVIRCFL